jgi:hypothetical protein
MAKNEARILKGGATQKQKLHWSKFDGY